MERQTILFVIGLMALSLLGIVAMQGYWVYNAVRLNEEQFDKRVFEAMNTITKTIETREAIAALDQIVDRYPNFALPTRDTTISIEEAADGTVQMAMQLYIPVTMGSRSAALPPDRNHRTKGKCYCRQCRNKERMQAFRNIIISQLFDKESLFRIQHANVGKQLTAELAKQGIRLSYDYGIYDPDLHRFVLSAHNGSATDSVYMQKIGYSKLLGSACRMALLGEQGSSGGAGYLMLYFPNKTGYVWQSVWVTLLGSVLFSGIILFCFLYTISVVFRQKKLSEIKNDFINNMTHEFKTPLATISLASDALTNPAIAANPERVKRFAKVIRDENVRMNKQVEKVLQIALLEKPKFRLKIKPIDVHEVIQTAADTIGLQIEQRGGTITQKLEATQHYITADEVHLTNVIYNLLDNANKYSPDTADITIETQDAADGLYVIVTDKGIGMSRESQKKIFDKFFRVAGGNVHDVKGFGLGLSYVKAIVEAHGGWIDVQSELGKGSSFRLFFLREAASESEG